MGWERWSWIDVGRSYYIIASGNMLNLSQFRYWKTCSNLLRSPRPSGSGLDSEYQLNGRKYESGHRSLVSCALIEMTQNLRASRGGLLRHRPRRMPRSGRPVPAIFRVQLNFRLSLSLRRYLGALSKPESPLLLRQ